MSRGWGIAFAVTLLLLLLSALVLVYAEHEARRLVAERERLLGEQAELDDEWGMLQLEQGAWSSHDRIEQLAVERFGMKAPQREDMVILSLQPRR